MSLKLTDDDRTAIDLLLDQGLSPEASGGGRAGFVTPSFDAVRVRLRHASELLKLLNHMPAIEPPSDLVAKTLAHIDRSTTIDPSLVPSRSSLFGLDRPSV